MSESVPPPAPAAQPGPAPPSVFLRVAGLIALIVIVGIDAWSRTWNPDPWVHLIGPLIIWGPTIVPALLRNR